MGACDGFLRWGCNVGLLSDGWLALHVSYCRYPISRKTLKKKQITAGAKFVTCSLTVNYGFANSHDCTYIQYTYRHAISIVAAAALRRAAAASLGSKSSLLSADPYDTPTPITLSQRILFPHMIRTGHGSRNDGAITDGMYASSFVGTVRLGVSH